MVPVLPLILIGQVIPLTQASLIQITEAPVGAAATATVAMVVAFVVYPIDRISVGGTAAGMPAGYVASEPLHNYGF